mmetsp:Transcript_23069/g.71926  ORF Transcript_23069/g.71926 Transcript_23069/m.71926 type:complete len:80 (+) Transcript_23069:15123-15362(+)
MENRSRDIRFSCDFRYQPATDIVSQRALTPNWDRATWPEVYAGWEDTSLQYYWERMDITVDEYDPNLVWFHSTSLEGGY